MFPEISQIGPFDLYYYQERAIRKINEAIRSGRRRMLVSSPCGSGKRILSCALMGGAATRGLKSLFVVSGRQLVYQKSRSLTDCGIHHSVLMSGEGYTISGVTVASKDTLWSRAYRQEKVILPEYDIVIVDEAHQSAAPQYAKIIKSFPDSVVVALTATPCRSDGRGLGGLFDTIVEMASYSELYEQDPPFLCPVEYYAPDFPDLTGVPVYGGDYSKKHLAELMDKAPLIGNIYLQWERLAFGTPTVVFCSSIKHSVHVAEVFNGHGVIADHIDQSTPQEERDRAFEALRDRRLSVVCNVGVCAVGWDAPWVETLVLARPTKSFVLYRQVTGRVIRTYPGKTKARIIDHSGAVWRHKFPTMDVKWTLNPGEVPEIEAPKGKQEPPEPRCCPVCACMWENGPECPNCGYRKARRGVPVRFKDGELIPVMPRKAKGAASAPKSPEAEWKRCLGIAANQGQNFWVARGIFRSKTGKLIESEGIGPLPPRRQWSDKVSSHYPNFLRRSKNGARTN